MLRRIRADEQDRKQDVMTLLRDPAVKPRSLMKYAAWCDVI